MRTCAKMRCDGRAVASVALRYADKAVVVVDLRPDHPDPRLIDLCEDHVAGLIPPSGWLVHDERSRMSVRR